MEVSDVVQNYYNFYMQYFFLPSVGVVDDMLVRLS